jgi:CheY-like chemotaxis protein
VAHKEKGCTLVVVDDNPWENQYTEMILRHIKDVTAHKFFPSGWQAFNYLDVCRSSGTYPDVILVDLLMEDMTGFDWIEHYEREYGNDFAGCLLFVCSHSQLEDDRKKAISYASVKGFLPKPLTPEKFNAYIRPLLP